MIHSSLLMYIAFTKILIDTEEKKRIEDSFDINKLIGKKYPRNEFPQSGSYYCWVDIGHVTDLEGAHELVKSANY